MLTGRVVDSEIGTGLKSPECSEDRNDRVGRSPSTIPTPTNATNYRRTRRCLSNMLDADLVVDQNHGANDDIISSVTFVGIPS